MAAWTAPEAVPLFAIVAGLPGKTEKSAFLTLVPPVLTGEVVWCILFTGCIRLMRMRLAELLEGLVELLEWLSPWAERRVPCSVRRLPWAVRRGVGRVGPVGRVGRVGRMKPMDKERVMSRYDVIVVGAGNGGLTAAATLAKAGVATLLLERHSVPGGCATSFCRGRFEFEVALHQLSGLGTAENPGPLRAVFEGLEVLDQLDLIVMEELYRTVGPDGLEVTLTADRNAVIAELQRRFPHEKEAIAAFFEFLAAFFMEVVGLFYLKDPAPTRDSYPRAFSCLLKTTQEVLDQFFKDPVLCRALTAYWGYLGLPPRRMPFVDWAMMFLAYIEYKPQHIRGGSQMLSAALADTFLKYGGTVRYNCGAARIVVQGDRVEGVLDDRGELVLARHVISNASRITTYADLIGREHLPDAAFSEMRGCTVGASAVTVYAGFDRSPEELGITNTTTFIGGRGSQDEEYEATRMLGCREETGLAMTCYTRMDSGFSPPGTTQAALIMLQYAEPWFHVPPEAYTAEKYKAADAMLARAETVYPGLRDHLEEMEISTPITHLRYLGHPGGAFYGFDQYVKDSASFVSPKPPVDGLYLAGAWAASGGFQPTLDSGVRAARQVLKHLGK